MEKFKEELARVEENNRHEVNKKLNDILSWVSDCEAKLQYLSEKVDDHISIQSSIIVNIFTSIFTLESNLRDNKISKDGDGDGGEEGDDFLVTCLIKDIPNERRSYVLGKVREIIALDGDMERAEEKNKLMFSGDINSNEFLLITLFMNHDGELTEKGVKERDKITKIIDGPGLGI